MTNQRMLLYHFFIFTLYKFLLVIFLTFIFIGSTSTNCQLFRIKQKVYLLKEQHFCMWTQKLFIGYNQMKALIVRKALLD